MSTDYLYLTIFEDIKKSIVSGVFKNGEKLPTEKALMDKYGVSRITAIKALQKLETEKLISRKRGSGSFVTYNDISTISAVSHAKTAQNRTIAYVGNVTVDVFGYILKHLQKSAMMRGYRVSIIDTSSSGVSQAQLIESINVGDFCGIVCEPESPFVSTAEYFSVIAKNIPLVFVDGGNTLFHVPYVKSNNYLGGYKLTRALIERGHSNIGIVFSDYANLNEQERFGGYLRALMEAGIPYNKENIVLYDDHRLFEKNTFKLLRESLREIMEKSNAPTAFFCMYDEIASLTEQYAFELGYKIPEDLSIAGYNNSTLCDRMITPLFSVDQNYQQIAEKTMEVLDNLINGVPVKLENLIEPMVISRESVRDFRKE